MISLKSCFSLISAPLFCLNQLSAQPVGGNVVFGKGDISGSPNNTSIQQDSSRLAIDWQSFDVESGQVVEFIQPSSDAIALNRDLSGTLSEIHGSINANGSVFIVNQSGVLFGADAMINTGGLLVTDLAIAMESFPEGSLSFADFEPTQGGIVNQGAIQTDSIAGVQLIGQHIENTGSIHANGADVHLTIANAVVVVTDPVNGLGVQLDQPISNALGNDQLIENSGDITALDGNIHFNTHITTDVAAAAVYNTGLVNAVAINEQNGRIFLTEQSTVPERSPEQQIEEIIEETQTALESTESTASEQTSAGTQVASSEGNTTTLNQVMPDCDPEKDEGDCDKHNALKSFLGRMLIGGGLP